MSGLNNTASIWQLSQNIEEEMCHFMSEPLFTMQIREDNLTLMRGLIKPMNSTDSLLSRSEARRIQGEISRIEGRKIKDFLY